MTIIISQQIKEHYQLEKKLANKIKNAPWPERGKLYIDSYNEIYQKTSNHPLMLRDTTDRLNATIRQLSMFRSFLFNQSVFLEVGPGNCSLLFEVSKVVKKAYGVDISGEITKNLIFPKNSQLLLSDGRNIPLRDNEIDVACSHQFIEHLHSEDAVFHLQEIFRVLKKGGVYICVTPNRLNGPHDISKYFDSIASCFHLKEYTISELSQIMKKIGFSKVKYILGFKKYFVPFPLMPSIFLEWVLHNISNRARLFFAKRLLIRILIEVRLVGYK